MTVYFDSQMDEKGKEAHLKTSDYHRNSRAEVSSLVIDMSQDISVQPVSDGPSFWLQMRVTAICFYEEPQSP